MNERISIGLVAFFVLAAPTAMAEEKSIVDTCVKAAQAQLAGNVVKMEQKLEDGKTIYEFEIRGKDLTKEFECDANSGKITESEIEVDNPEDARFKSKAKISLEQAKAIALKKHPGQIVETEFEIEDHGRASYEFDIKTPEGHEVKIEIDAETGNIAEDDEKEIYQIGEEKD